ncbi:RNA polymerase III subunit C82 [Apophysomyces sp. BC1034]|nr:RNA polymerase III subunit C82 [Apophysomyces sp. BC1015]KAG0182228.1 RNA polymerase III subunit C82 [Apophysomyces sp. BC1021]KAG0192949.1 RNA polymerase III subunit C82 [Apophysomyces sp. BC1034]
MSQEARLCREILEEEFGPFVAKVAHQMLLKGRLSLHDIARFTQISQRQVRESLVVLIQHGIAHFTEPIGGQREPTYYNVSPDQITLRLRMAPITVVTEEKFGKEAAMVCKLLFVNGRMRLPDVCAWVSANDDKAKNKLANYRKAFTKMAAEHFITAVLPEHSRSAIDRFIAAEEKETEKYTITTAKELQAIKRAAQAQVDAEYSMSENIGMKRKATDSMGPEGKRRNYDKGEEEEEEIEIDESVFFSVNYERYNMLFRNNAIVDFATLRINRTAGQVVKAFFDYGKDKMKTIKEEDSASATPLHIANIMPPEVAGQGDLVLQPDPLEPNRKPTLQETIRGYIMLLKTDQAGFVKSKDDRGANQFAVNFSKLRESMRRRLLEGLVREKHGVATCRIMRILIEKGKLDESQVQKLAMLPPKDTREKLGLLNTKGFVEIQEVPRSADRAPGRSFHLWYVPLEKIYQELLVDAYRAIGNLQQRKREELKIRSRLLDKLNREDVKENMDLLGEGDKAEVAQMEKVMERIEVSKKRLDEMVMVLRDF